MGIQDVMNKRRLLRSKGENGRCCPEQSGVTSHLAGDFTSSNRSGGDLVLWPSVFLLLCDLGCCPGYLPHYLF